MSKVKKPMTLIVIDDAADKVHMALMVGATAAAMGRPVLYFFSKSAVKAVTNEGHQLAYGNGQTQADMDAILEENGVADTALLFDALAALNVRFIACESAMAEHNITVDNLITRPQIEIGGIAEIIEKGTGGDWLTF